MGGGERTGASSSKSKYVTDKGRSITIDDPQRSSLSLAQQAQIHQTITEIYNREGLHAEQLSDYDPSYNCHSYTFTDGKVGLIANGEEVKRILQDNDFQSIASENEDGYYTYTQIPQKGDIILYKDSYDNPNHSGVISRVENDPKKMMVKSKMNKCATFEHSATIPKNPDPGFFEATHWEIFHTDRPQGRLITEASCSDEE